MKTSSAQAPSSKRYRTRAASTGLFIATLIGMFSFYDYWGRQQDHALYLFSAHAKAPLVPVHCDEPRGKAGADYIVASARRIHQRKNYAEACWYPIDRFRMLFPAEGSMTDAAIIRDHFQKMDFPVTELRPSLPSHWSLIGMLIAVLIAVLGILVAVLGPRKTVEVEFQAEWKPTFDTAKLASELALLRKKLEGSTDGR